MKAILGHLEIPARDLERAAAFYRDAFGWRVEPVPWEEHPYYTIRVDAGESAPPVGGGLLPAADLGSTTPLPVIHLQEGTLEECLRRVQRAGGAVDRPPRAVGAMGRYARFRDTEGNLFGLWQPLPRR